MKIEKLSASLYSVLGILSGFISDYFSFSFVPLILPLIIFVGSMYFILKKFKPNKRKKFVAENFLTFVLFWVVVWILLFNSG